MNFEPFLHSKNTQNYTRDAVCWKCGDRVLGRVPNDAKPNSIIRLCHVCYGKLNRDASDKDGQQ